MADVETKLRWLSERGNPVGAEELIERIEADLAGDPLVVVAKRRERAPMTTKTRPSPTTRPPRRHRGPVLAVAIFVAVLALPALYFAFSGGDEPVADTQPTPTTVAPDVETMTDLEVIETGVAALYSGDAERAAELFELPDRTDDELRREAAYQAAIGGRLTLRCIELDTPGAFRCTTPYHNSLTDAIDYVDSGDNTRVVVEDGVIRAFAFPEHSFIVVGMGAFLATEGRLEGYEDCAFGPFAESCAAIQLENLDAWAEWRETVEPATLVESALESWYGGDCQAALFISGDQFWDDTPIDCSTESTLAQTIEYESILAADVSLGACEETPIADDAVNISCDVRYSNAMNTVVGRPPTVTTKEFTVMAIAVVRQPGTDRPWHEDDYPENTELLQSFRQFAEGGGLQEEYAEARCASERTPDCANLIVDNLDDWAAWYETNG